MDRQSRSRYSSEYNLTLPYNVELVYLSTNPWGNPFAVKGFNSKFTSLWIKKGEKQFVPYGLSGPNEKHILTNWDEIARKYQWAHVAINAHKIKLLILAYRKGCFLSSAVRAWMCPQHHEQAHTASAGASYFRSSHNFFKVEKKEV